MTLRRTRGPAAVLLAAAALPAALLTAGRAAAQPTPAPVLSPYAGCSPVPYRAPNCPSPYAPLPTQPTPQNPTNPANPSNPANPTNPTQQPENAAQNPSNLESEASGARGENTASIAAPNLLGDLLYSSRSVRFGFVRINANTDFTGLGSTSIVNSNVDENNSPLPEDRVYFRYNYFNNAQSVTGISSSSTVFIPGNPPALNQLPQTRSYDTNLYTFGVEKTFFDDMASVELRLRSATGVASHNTPRVGAASGRTGPPDVLGNAPFNVAATPQDTLGHDDTEFGNLTLIFKGLMYQNRCSGWYVSGGAGLTIPTGEDAHLAVIDYAGDSTAAAVTNIQRERILDVANETWSLSPFVAALYTPNDRFFTQGFASVEVPLGSSRVSYSESYPRGGFPPGDVSPLALPTSMVPPFSVTDRINEQTLLHLDWNVGWWLYRADGCRGLTGVAPCFEVHYTGTLDKADHVQLPGNANFTDVNAARMAIPDVGPLVGAPNDSTQIVDLTAGSTFAFGRRTTLATAFHGAGDQRCQPGVRLGVPAPAELLLRPLTGPSHRPDARARDSVPTPLPAPGRLLIRPARRTARRRGSAHSSRWRPGKAKRRRRAVRRARRRVNRSRPGRRRGRRVAATSWSLRIARRPGRGIRRRRCRCPRC